MTSMLFKVAQHLGYLHGTKQVSANRKEVRPAPPTPPTMRPRSQTQCKRHRPSLHPQDYTHQLFSTMHLGAGHLFPNALSIGAAEFAALDAFDALRAAEMPVVLDLLGGVHPIHDVPIDTSAQAKIDSHIAAAQPTPSILTQYWNVSAVALHPPHAPSVSFEWPEAPALGDAVTYHQFQVCFQEALLPRLDSPQPPPPTAPHAGHRLSPAAEPEGQRPPRPPHPSRQPPRPLLSPATVPPLLAVP